MQRLGTVRRWCQCSLQDTAYPLRPAGMLTLGADRVFQPIALPESIPEKRSGLQRAQAAHLFMAVCSAHPYLTCSTPSTRRKRSLATHAKRESGASAMAPLLSEPPLEASRCPEWKRESKAQKTAAECPCQLQHQLPTAVGHWSVPRAQGPEFCVCCAE